jgi:cystathionine beta-lyase
MGYSWGGFESLILGINNVNTIRSATSFDCQFPLIRLHIGLEDVSDLINDLEQGFDRFNESLAAS